MQVLTELPSIYISELAKLNELLRFYMVTKKSEKFSLVREKTKQKINKVIETLRSFSCFQEVEDDVLARVEKTFQQILRSNRAPSEKNSSKQSISSANKGSNIGSEKQVSSLKVHSSPIKKTGSLVIEEPKLEKKVIFNHSEPVRSQNSEKFESKKEEGSKRNSIQPITSAMQLITPQISDNQSKESGLMEIISEVETVKNNQSNRVLPIQEKIEENFMKESISSIQSTPGGPPSESFFMIQSVNSMDRFQEKDKVQQKEREKEKEKEEQKPKNLERSNSNSLDSREEDLNSEHSSRFSEISCTEDSEDMIVKFLSDNRDKLNKALIFNNELFQVMDKELDGHFYLFGVNKPENNRIIELYGCTLMKFLTAELFKSESKFQKEAKDFSKNIRVPLGLIFKGQPQQIVPQHIKFLLTLESPFPVVLTLKSDQANEGWICSFSDSIIDSIRITPRKQLSQFTEDLKKKITIVRYSEEDFPEDKNKVMTKYLPREIPTFPQQAPNAITISGNECIREQKNCFTYKLHTKFFNQMKNSENFIYYVNNNIVNARTLFQKKDFEVFKKIVLENQSKVPMMLGFTVNKDTNVIKKQFFQLLFESKSKRDPFFFINLNTLTVKKTVIATLNSDVTMDKIKVMNPLPYKDFQKDTIFTSCAHLITKTNIKQFETEGMEQMVNVVMK